MPFDSKVPKFILCFLFLFVHIHDIPSGTPHAIMLVKGKLYRTNSWEDIKDFAISEYEISMSESIPPLPSIWDTLNSNPHGQLLIFLVVGFLILAVMGVLARLLLGNPHAETESTKKKK